MSWLGAVVAVAALCDGLAAGNVEEVRPHRLNP